MRRYLAPVLAAIVLSACGGGSNDTPDVASDTSAPTITLLGDNPQTVEAATAYTELGATATDDIDGDLSDEILVDADGVDTGVPGDYQVIYSVRDTAGNVATATRAVTVVDTTPPVITLVGDDPQVIITGDAYTDFGATATDSLDGDLTAAIVTDSSGVDTGMAGDYLVTYDVTDAAGNAAATVTRTVRVEDPLPPPAPSVSVEGSIRKLVFSWTETDGAAYYRLLENADGHSGFSQAGDDIPADRLTVSRNIAVHLLDWLEARYIVEACNAGGCSGSDVVTVTDAMLDTIGYFKASNTDPGDQFGSSIALSGDGRTLAVGTFSEGAVYVFRYDETDWYQQARVEASNAGRNDSFGRAVALSFDGSTLAVGATNDDSGATGVNAGGQDHADNSLSRSGAVYVFRSDGSDWTQQAFVKASNPDRDDFFGSAVALSEDGNTLAVGATGEDSGIPGINGNPADNSASSAGAVYLFRFDGGSWRQQAYIKASNAGLGDQFGVSLALSADGNSLAAGARFEASRATGINGDENDDVALRNFGAAYLFRFDGTDWYQQAYIKASNTGMSDRFGSSVAVSADGDTLAVGALEEDSLAAGINGDQDDDVFGADSGAVYVFRFDENDWYQQAYIKSSNTGEGDLFGNVALDADGNLLAVGAPGEDSMSAGIDGDAFDEHPVGNSGAVYVFRFDGANWLQHAYVKAPNTGSGARTPECESSPRPELCEQPGDQFGSAVALSADGMTLAVGAINEGSSATGIGGDRSDDAAPLAGAAYIY